MSFAEKAYIGTLDDVVARYPWGGNEGYTLEGYIEQRNPILDKKILTSFNATLQFNALFGREMLINDGYILNHPAAKIALLEPKRSPLRALMEGGRIQILQRNIEFDLDETALDMASKNNSSFQKLSELPDWNSFRQELRNISRLSGVKKRWPKYDISEGLNNFFSSLSDPDIKNSLDIVSGNEIENLLCLYKNIKNGQNRAPRDAWELAAKAQFKDCSEKLFEVMQLANIYYHMNFSLCLASESPTGVAVETMSSLHLEDMLERRESNLSDTDAMDIKKVLEELSGRMYFPSPEEALDGEKLCELYSGIKGSAGEAKSLFLEEVARYQNQNIKSNKENLRVAADNYTQELHRIFDPKKPVGKLEISVDGTVVDDIRRSGRSGATSFIGGLIKNLPLESAWDVTGATAATSICIDFGKRIALAALPYVVPLKTGQDSQFLKNIKNRNKLFNNLIVSTPVNMDKAKKHVSTLKKFS